MEIHIMSRNLEKFFVCRILCTYYTFFATSLAWVPLMLQSHYYSPLTPLLFGMAQIFLLLLYSFLEWLRFFSFSYTHFWNDTMSQAQVFILVIYSFLEIYSVQNSAFHLLFTPFWKGTLSRTWVSKDSGFSHHPVTLKKELRFFSSLSALFLSKTLILISWALVNILYSYFWTTLCLELMFLQHFPLLFRNTLTWL